MKITDQQWRAFATWGWDARQYAQSTRNLYIARCKAAERSMPVPLYHATTDHLAVWHRTLPATAASRNVSRQALLAFYDWQIDTTTRATNPARPLPTYRYPDTPPRALDGPEAAAVLAVDAHLQWRFGLSLLFHSALRATEARLLEWDRLTDGWVQVTVKGGRERILPLHEHTIALAAAWRAQCPSPRWVFPSPLRDAARSESSFRERIKTVAANAGVAMTPHVARHTCGTRMAEQGVNVRVIQELFGHRSLATTQRYLRARPRHLADAIGGLRFAS